MYMVGFLLHVFVIYKNMPFINYSRTEHLLQWQLTINEPCPALGRQATERKRNHRR
jgi:hypothetical protein